MQIYFFCCWLILLFLCKVPYVNHIANFYFFCLAFAAGDLPSKFVVEKGYDSELEEFKLSEEVENFILGKSDVHVLSERGKEELVKYEEYCAAFSKRRRTLLEAAAPQTSKDGSAIRSITPKFHPQKVRVRNRSRFVQPPFDGALTVTAEEESVYQKLMLSNSHQRPSKSNIKR